MTVTAYYGFLELHYRNSYPNIRNCLYFWSKAAFLALACKVEYGLNWPYYHNVWLT